LILALRLFVFAVSAFLSLYWRLDTDG